MPPVRAQEANLTNQQINGTKQQASGGCTEATPDTAYDNIAAFETLYRAYRSARVSKRSKEAVAKYERNAMAYTAILSEQLERGVYRPGKFETFTVYEPKKRLVQAPAFRDKVVQHAVVDNYLYDRITGGFVRANAASQKGKGTHFALDNLKWDMTDYYRKQKTVEGWVLKCDVRHFFASINRDILKEKLKRKIDEPRIYNLMCIYIDSSEEGLPLGYQTSQLFALLYLDEMDHFIKEKLHIRYYGRYMDDFYLIHPDKTYLQHCRKEIERFLQELKLELNEKTQIFPLRNGVDFIGFHTYLTESGKVVRKLRKDSIKRIRKKIKLWRKAYPAGTVTEKEILNHWKGWDAYAAFGNTWTLRRQIAAEVGKIVHQRLVPHNPIKVKRRL